MDPNENLRQQDTKLPSNTVDAQEEMTTPADGIHSEQEMLQNPRSDNNVENVQNPSGDHAVENVEKASEDNTVLDVEKPNEDITVPEVEKQSEDNTVQDAQNPSKDNTVHNIEKPSEDNTVPDVVLPSEDNTVPDVEKHNEDNTVKDVVKPSKDNTVKDVVKPNEDNTAPDVKKPNEDSTVPDVVKPIEDNTVQDAEKLSEDNTLQDVEKLNEDNTKQDVEKLNEDNTVPDVVLPSEDNIAPNVRKPTDNTVENTSENNTVLNVENTSENNTVLNVEKPSENNTVLDVEKPSEDSTVPEVEKPSEDKTFQDKLVNPISDNNMEDVTDKQCGEKKSQNTFRGINEVEASHIVADSNKKDQLEIATGAIAQNELKITNGKAQTELLNRGIYRQRVMESSNSNEGDQNRENISQENLDGGNTSEDNEIDSSDQNARQNIRSTYPISLLYDDIEKKRKRVLENILRELEHIRLWQAIQRSSNTNSSEETEPSRRRRYYENRQRVLNCNLEEYHQTCARLYMVLNNYADGTSEDVQEVLTQLLSIESQFDYLSEIHRDNPLAPEFLGDIVPESIFLPFYIISILLALIIFFISTCLSCFVGRQFQR